MASVTPEGRSAIAKARKEQGLTGYTVVKGILDITAPFGAYLNVYNSNREGRDYMMVKTSSDGPAFWRLENRLTSNAYDVKVDGSGNFTISETDQNGSDAFTLTEQGNLTINGTLTQSSSRNMKNNFKAVDNQEILDRLNAIPIQEWSYIHTQDQTHMGVMAQDFYAAFGLGAGETGISSVDTAGVAFASIQALTEQIAERDVLIEQLMDRLDKLEANQK